MPETWKETKWEGKPMFNVLTGVSRDGQEFWFSFGLKKAQAVLENIDALRVWVDRIENPHGHKEDFGG